MLTTAQGHLTIVDGRAVFWNGAPVTGVVQVALHADEDEVIVKLRVAGNDDALYAELDAAGIKVKKVGG
jgi:hypothetical protein